MKNGGVKNDERKLFNRQVEGVIRITLSKYDGHNMAIDETTKMRSHLRAIRYI